MESKAEKFTRLRDQRLPKILHSLDILSNLSGTGYDYTEGQARDMVGVLRDAVEKCAKKFGCDSLTMTAGSNTSATLTGSNTSATLTGSNTSATLTGSNTSATPLSRNDRAEVAWAYDALRRGDTKLAQARLKMILDATR